ncbi:MAG: conjugal transfer protein TraD [Caulobacteraceae bacterium]
MQRRERTRHLLELGGLVVKARLDELTGDDRAVLLGAFLGVADILSGEDRNEVLALWRRRGARAFNAAREEHRAIDARPPSRPGAQRSGL